MLVSTAQPERVCAMCVVTPHRLIGANEPEPRSIHGRKANNRAFDTASDFGLVAVKSSKDHVS